MNRILGWDMLRGWCALGVAFYHLLSWQEVTNWHSIGTHCVYLFFVLSGASLTYTYWPKFKTNQFDFKRFILVRYFRLAPLYVLLVMMVLPWKIDKYGLDAWQFFKIVLNVLLLFGFYEPVKNSMLVGGWSLGIEFVFYFVFSFLCFFWKNTTRAIAVLIILMVIQFLWIEFTIGSASGSVDSVVLYHHVPAFIAYFTGGCYIGYLRLNHHWRQPPAQMTGLVFLFSWLCLIAALNAEDPWEHLTGWRNAALFVVCFILAFVAGEIELRGKMGRMATFFGDTTYGIYLIHPVVFFGLSWVVIPKLSATPLLEWSLANHLMLTFGVVMLSVAFALGSDRWIERPIRNWSRRRFASANVSINLTNRS